MSSLVRVCSVNDVAAESAIPVEVPRNGRTVELAIVHSSGAFYAIADECSHASIPLSEGDVGDGEIECYLTVRASTYALESRLGCQPPSRYRSTDASSKATTSWSMSLHP